MGELLTAPGSRVPHHGPVTRDCPVECLLAVLSRNSFNPLTRAYDAPFAESALQLYDPVERLPLPCGAAGTKTCHD